HNRGRGSWGEITNAVGEIWFRRTLEKLHGACADKARAAGLSRPPDFRNGRIVLPLTCRARGKGVAVPIHAVLRKQQETEGVILSPEDITDIVAAYEIALERLGVTDRKAPMALLVAKTTPRSQERASVIPSGCAKG